jgi:hypothetical protein
VYTKARKDDTKRDQTQRHRGHREEERKKKRARGR